jgi:hypothetical protein
VTAPAVCVLCVNSVRVGLVGRIGSRVDGCKMLILLDGVYWSGPSEQAGAGSIPTRFRQPPRTTN